MCKRFFIIVAVCALACIVGTLLSRVEQDEDGWNVSNTTVSEFANIKDTTVNRIEFRCLDGEHVGEYFEITDEKEIRIVINDLIDLKKTLVMPERTGNGEPGYYDVWLYDSTTPQAKFEVLDEKTVSIFSKHFRREKSKKLEMIKLFEKHQSY